jgi:hypothetical protein
MPSFSISCAWLKKQGVLLVLLFAFLLTALLVVQQQRTIDSQRMLIHQLFADSQELEQLKIHSAMRR